MGRQSAKDAYLAILESSAGKTKAAAQEDTVALIDIIADMIEESSTSTDIATSVVTNAPATGTGTQVGAVGSISVPS